MIVLALAVWLIMGCALGAASVRRPSLRNRLRAEGLREGSLWIEDAMHYVDRDSDAWRWLNGSVLFLRQYAAEHTDHIDFHAPFAPAYKFWHRANR